jgi:hypothetical protein
MLVRVKRKLKKQNLLFKKDLGVKLYFKISGNNTNKNI